MAKVKQIAQLEADLAAARGLARKYRREWMRWSARRVPEDVLNADVAAHPWLEEENADAR
jgi:hypothetical protein